MCLVIHTYDKISKYPPSTVDNPVVMQASSDQITTTLKLYVKNIPVRCPSCIVC